MNLTIVAKKEESESGVSVNPSWIGSTLETAKLAGRSNLRAGLILWAFGSAIVAAYYFWPAGQSMFNRIADLKVAWGFLFSMVSTAIFGGLIPSLITATRNELGVERNIFLIWTNVLLWGLKGIEVDLLYRGQAVMFGDDNQISTILFKTLFDQFIYVPLIGVTNVVLFLLWRDLNFSVRDFRHSLGPNWYRNRVLPVVVTCWGVWIPAVILIYCLPLSLQLPIQNLVLVFWNLILFFFTTGKKVEA